MIQVEQAAQLEADERGAEVGGNAEQVEEEEVYCGGGPYDMFCTNASTMCFDIILTST